MILTYAFILPNALVCLFHSFQHFRMVHTEINKVNDNKHYNYDEENN